MMVIRFDLFIMAYSKVFLFSFLFQSSSSFFLPKFTPINYCRSTDSPQYYFKNEVELFDNRLVSEESHISYRYNDFFCSASTSSSNLLDILFGERTRIPFRVKWLEYQRCRPVCIRSFHSDDPKSIEKLDFLKQGIRLNYRHHWIAGDVPVYWCPSPDNCATSFPMGCYVGSHSNLGNYCNYNLENGTYVLFNHFELDITYVPASGHEWGIELGICDGGRIVSVTVTPSSRKYDLDCQSTQPMFIMDEKLTGEIKILYTYSVNSFTKTENLKWSPFWNYLGRCLAYGYSSVLQALEFILFMSVVVALIVGNTIYKKTHSHDQLSGLTHRIKNVVREFKGIKNDSISATLKSLPKLWENQTYYEPKITDVTPNIDVQPQNKEDIFMDSEDSKMIGLGKKGQEEHPWLLIYHDVFRSPKMGMLLSILLGSGVHIFVTTPVALGLAKFGLKEILYRRLTLICSLVISGLLASLAGITSAKIYKSFGGKKWKLNAVLTSVFCPGIVLSILLILNLIIFENEGSAAVPFSKLVSLYSLWFICSIPMSLLGSHYEFKRKVVVQPVQTNEIPRKIPEQRWFIRPLPSSLIGGLFLFVLVLLQLFFVFNHIWFSDSRDFVGHNVIVFLYLILLNIIVTCSETTILLCYLHLHAEDYRWCWRSFLTSGFSAVYLFINFVYYFYARLEIEDTTSTMVYFGYSLIIAWLFFLLSGSIGFFACFFFVRLLYRGMAVNNKPLYIYTLSNDRSIRSEDRIYESSKSYNY